MQQQANVDEQLVSDVSDDFSYTLTDSDSSSGGEISEMDESKEEEGNFSR